MAIDDLKRAVDRLDKPQAETLRDTERWFTWIFDEEPHSVTETLEQWASRMIREGRYTRAEIDRLAKCKVESVSWGES